MTPIAWMVGASLVSWLAVSAFGGDRINPESLYGMLGPLAAGCATWVAVHRAWRASPQGMWAVMMTGFAAKVVFFGVYVAVFLRVLQVRPVPFVLAFVCYFIALYAMQAVFLRRLTAQR